MESLALGVSLCVALINGKITENPSNLAILPIQPSVYQIPGCSNCHQKTMRSFCESNSRQILLSMASLPWCQTPSTDLIVTFECHFCNEQRLSTVLESFSVMIKCLTLYSQVNILPLISCIFGTTSLFLNTVK